MTKARSNTLYALIDALTEWADENDKIAALLEKRIKALEATKSGPSYVDLGGSTGPRR